MRLPFLLAAVSASQHHPSPQHTVAAGALRTAQSEKAECDSDTQEGERLREAINGTQRPLCAIGDMHGDPNHALRALRLCDAVDEAGRWSGGTMTVVQVGDVFDRGNASIALQHVLWELRDQAAEAGGELKLLMGNHELMNLQGRIHYVHGFSRAGDHRGAPAPSSPAPASEPHPDPSPHSNQASWPSLVVPRHGSSCCPLLKMTQSLCGYQLSPTS